VYDDISDNEFSAWKGLKIKFGDRIAIDKSLAVMTPTTSMKPAFLGTLKN
jgi:hypothetical protein